MITIEKIILDEKIMFFETIIIATHVMKATNTI